MAMTDETEPQCLNCGHRWGQHALGGWCLAHYWAEVWDGSSGADPCKCPGQHLDAKQVKALGIFSDSEVRQISRPLGVPSK